MTEKASASQYLISYFHSMGCGRSFATLDRGGVPCELDINGWESKVEKNNGLHQVGITSFQLIDTMPGEAQVTRIPAGLYAELEALRTLRDATRVYRDSYMRGEIEDEDSCVSVDQHDAACSVQAALESAQALKWKGGSGE
ncbi:hypothetical protein [Pseudomonas leptonychotis]|uniref:hypothetical protein n=1 Tax=Pseudomonas leptonychotis TaxID=2448482 RepID=UPI003864AB8C